MHGQSNWQADGASSDGAWPVNVIDLRQPHAGGIGRQGGQGWCLCAGKEICQRLSFEAVLSGQKRDQAVCQVQGQWLLT
jgi:hypothetical protein